jgi:hypothetical protein
MSSCSIGCQPWTCTKCEDDVKAKENLKVIIAAFVTVGGLLGQCSVHCDTDFVTCRTFQGNQK